MTPEQSQFWNINTSADFYFLSANWAWSVTLKWSMCEKNGWMNICNKDCFHQNNNFQIIKTCFQKVVTLWSPFQFLDQFWKFLNMLQIALKILKNFFLSKQFPNHKNMFSKVAKMFLQWSPLWSHGIILWKQHTFNHLSIHLLWYSWRHGNMRTCCFCSKSIKHMTQRDSPMFLFFEATLYVGRLSRIDFDMPFGFSSTMNSSRFTTFSNCSVSRRPSHVTLASDVRIGRKSGGPGFSSLFLAARPTCLRS